MTLSIYSNIIDQHLTKIFFFQHGGRRMKKYLFFAVVASVVLVAAFPAFAAPAKESVSIDGSLIFATEPMSGYDATIGIGVGALVDLTNRMSMSNKNVKLGIRGDLSYFDWEGDFFGIGVDYRRFVIFGGPRFTFQPAGNAKVAPYVEGGLELTYDDYEVGMPGFGTVSTSGFSLGLAGGGGIDFILAPNMKLGVNGRLHLVSDSFLSLGVTLGFLF